MDRIRWSEKSMSFRKLIDNETIAKPILVQIGSKAIVVGEKINGEFILASPCRLFGDRFDVMGQEIVLSSKHTGIWRVISKSTSKNEDHIHRLTTREIERIHRKDMKKERPVPRSYICIREIEAFEVILRGDDPTVMDGCQIERRVKQIEENVEFEITDVSEVEYTPSAGERTSQDYTLVPKNKQNVFMQLLLPGVVVQERLVRNRIFRALHCVTKSESRKRHFLLEVNEQPCEIRPIASPGSSELRYLHSTKNLFDFMRNHEPDTMLYVKLLRGDPPIKAVEFDGYMLLKNTLDGDRIPICRVEDLEVTLVSPDLPLRVRLPTRSEQIWRSMAEVRAAEVQCMQLSLALLARHESEMYISIEENRTSNDYLQLSYNEEQRTHKSSQPTDVLQQHLKECMEIFASSQPTRNEISSEKYSTRTDFDKNLSSNDHTKHKREVIPSFDRSQRANHFRKNSSSKSSLKTNSAM